MILEEKLSVKMKKYIKNYKITEDKIGMSPAKVYKLSNDKEILYLKISDRKFKGTTYEVKREKDIMLWLEGKISVPKVIYFEENLGYDFLLMSKADGENLEYINLTSKKLVEIYAKSIREVQAIDISMCPFLSDVEYRLSELDYLVKSNLSAVSDFYEGNIPFSKPEELVVYLKNNMPDEEIVFSHGDICDSNIFVSNNCIKSFIDWGRGGKADKWYDIALCVRNIREDLKNERYVDLFFNLLQIKPDWDKIKYYIWLDELF